MAPDIWVGLNELGMGRESVCKTGGTALLGHVAWFGCVVVIDYDILSYNEW